MVNVFDDIENADGTFRRLTKSDMRARMDRLAPRAFRSLELDLTNGDGKIRVAAALGILDRCGFGPQSKITVDDNREDLSSLSREQLAARAAQIARQLLEEEQERTNHQGPFEEPPNSVH